ncbi:MAG: c-type cytochrome [Steroidobacteraceae bacterium]
MAKSILNRWGIALLLLILLGAGSLWLRNQAEASRLVRTDPADILTQPDLLRYAHERAAKVYAANCVSCHGADRKGDQKRGVPNLVDGSWIYAPNVVDLEHTITYGIRSGHPKARNVAEMPGFVLIKQLNETEVNEVAEYVLALSGQPHDESQIEAGRKIFYDKGNCFDCHASDAKGVVDYGAPALLGPDWIYGGDRATLRRTIYGGRHGKCPAWIDILSPADIRALAIDLLPARSAASGK